MIREVMKFSSFGDFYIKRECIRAMFVRLPREDKALYKYYLYSRRYIKERMCDIMWEYINKIDLETEESFYIDSVLEKEYDKYRN